MKKFITLLALLIVACTTEGFTPPYEVIEVQDPRESVIVESEIFKLEYIFCIFINRLIRQSFMFFVKNNKPFRFELIYLNVYGSAYDQPIMLFLLV